MLKSGSRWKILKHGEGGTCKVSRFRRPFYQSQLVGKCYQHASCLCTERNSVSKRVFVAQQAVSARVRCEYNKCRRRLVEAYKSWGLEPFTAEEVIARSPRPTVYQREWDRICENGYEERDSWVKLFVKADKLNKTSLSLKPRAIQSRNEGFNVLFGRFALKFANRNKRFKGVHGGKVRCFAKGRNAKQRGTDIYAKVSRFTKSTVYVVDATSFDGSVQQLHLRLCHAGYKAAFPGQPDLEFACNCQLHNKVYSSNGLVYTIDGNRMSGDMDTGSGNDVISYYNAFAVMRCLGIANYEVYIDGDDMLLMVSRADAVEEAVIDQLFYECGFTTNCSRIDVEGDATLAKIEFGRSRLGYTDQWELLRNPRRSLACFGVTHKYESDRVYMEVLKGASHGEAVVSRHIPMLGPLAHAVYESITGAERYDFEYHKRTEYMRAVARPVAPPRVSATTRYWVDLCWGVDEEQQLYFESRIPELTSMLTRQWDQRFDQKTLTTPVDYLPSAIEPDWH